MGLTDNLNERLKNFFKPSVAAELSASVNPLSFWACQLLTADGNPRLDMNGAAPTVASATTIAPVTEVFFVSGTTAVVTITPPPGFATSGGTLVALPTGLFTWTAAGNIAVAGSAVVGQRISFTYDPTTLKYYPSVTSAAGFVSQSATAGVGYGVGAGAAYTQITSVTTAVATTTLFGKITTFAQTLIAGNDVTFRVTNTVMAENDLPLVGMKSYGGTADGIPIVNVQSSGAGEFYVNIRNTGAVTLDALCVFNYAIFKGAIT